MYIVNIGFLRKGPNIPKTVGIANAPERSGNYCLIVRTFIIYDFSILLLFSPLIVINHSPSSETFHSIIFPTYIYFPFSRSYLRRSHRVRLRYLFSFVTYTYLLNIPAVLLNYSQVFRATRAHKNTFPTALSRPLTGQRYSRLSRSGSWP